MDMAPKSPIAELEGIFAQGYGIVAKAVMLDPELHITAKAIYAYLCSYSGKGKFVYPKRETILNHLGISKECYYKHYKTLIAHGYIVVKKAKNYINRNIYIIANSPGKIKSSESSGFSSNLKINGVLSRGYGFVPKSVMTDKSISAKAKSLYAYLSVFAQNGQSKFPSVEEILMDLKIGKTAYYNALNQLLEEKYITISQRDYATGRFSANDYIFNLEKNSHNNSDSQECNYVENFKPNTQKQDYVENSNSPYPQKQDNVTNRIDKPLSPYPQKQDNIKNRINKPFPPYPQKQDNGDNPPYPQKQDIEKQDNNNSTCFNNNISLSSIYQSSSTITNNQDDGLIEKLKNDIFTVHDLGLPTNLNINDDVNKQIIVHGIRTLSFVDEVIARTSSDYEFRTDYKMAVSCLEEMSTELESNRYRNTVVSHWQVLEKINDCLTDDFEGKSLRDFLAEFLIHYRAAAKTFVIKNHSRYMKSMLWDYLSIYVA